MTSFAQLLDADTQTVLVEQLEIADGFWSRFKGLQFRKELPPNSGLLLTPCSSIHTFFMRFSLDLAFLDKAGLVLGVRSNVPPWRMVWAPSGTHSVLEMMAGSMQVLPQARLLVQSREDPGSK